MPLTTGTRLGPYEILAPIGAGGMGEVYRAKDTKLKRDVALKVLPAAFARDPERMARFQREAEVLASLNHPNIAAIYGVEHADGTQALAMEMVEGESPKGPLAFDDAWHIASQITAALEYAHDKGVIHRDLKPANIKVTPEGTVKLLDFGLAKAFTTQREGQSATGENSPTLTLGATEVGMILGTAAYMAPEQARGKNVNKRADIWSFGVVLYELLTGERMFQGEEATDTLAQVLTKQPDLSRVPVKVRWLLERCLEKDPKKRLRDIGDATALMETRTESESAAGPRPAHRRPFAWIATAAVLLVGFAALGFLHFRETPPADPVLRLSVPLPGNAGTGFVALSPDGRRLVITLFTEGKAQLWLRSLDSQQLRLVAGTDGARAPFWSPDSKFIGFFADGKLKTIAASGGPPQVLCEGTGFGAGGTWNRDGVILFSTSGVGDPLQRVNASGGACTAVTKPEGGSRHAYPEFLPDGKHFVFVVPGGDEAKRGLYLAALDHPGNQRLLADVSSALFVPSITGKKHGYLLFLRGSELMAQPFSAETLQLAGEVTPVAAEVSFSFNAPLIAASASSGGILVYESNIGTASFQLTWLDRSGKELGKVGSVQDQRHVGLSPDGKTVVTARRTQGIWLYDVLRGGETRFTSPTLPGGAGVWSPEGNLIAFGSGKGLYLKDASGGLQEELLLENENLKAPSDWSRDGHYLIYTETDPKGRGDIWFMEDPHTKSSERKPVKFQGTVAVESQGQLSPDGRWLAYASDESGQSEIYVRPFPFGAGRWKISAGGGGGIREPRWRRDGKELFFLQGGLSVNHLVAVPVQSGPRGDFQAGDQKTLFQFRAIGTVPTANAFLYSPSPDGQRFLVNAQAGDTEPTLNVISNWEKAALGSN